MRLDVSTAGLDRAPAREGTRDQIIRTSAALFADRGYHGTGLTEILQAVGIGKGGFYHHISSKSALLLEIMLEPIDKVLASGGVILESEDSPRQQVVRLGQELGKGIAGDLTGWTVFLREYSALDPLNRSLVLDRRKNYLDQWRHVLHLGVRTGDFREIDLAFVESILGLFVYTFVWDGKETRHDLLTESVMTVLLHGVCTKAE